jgi:hypothetical protein
MKIVEVVWHDAHDQSETWMLISDIDGDPYVVRSVGYMLDGRKAGHVVIAQSMGSEAEGTVDNVLAIPLGMVQSMREFQ